MRIFIVAALLLIFGVQEQMVAPKVEHKQHETTTTYNETIRTCPSGYEAHFVDTQIGFNNEQWAGNMTIFLNYDGGPLGYTICFKKEFMDEIRKNPELLTNRPPPPKPV